MGVYIYTEEQEWQPGENTMMYLNFGTTTGDLVDRSPNSSNVVASRRNNSYTCFEQGTNGYHLNFPGNYNYMVDVADNSTIRGADNWYIGFWFMVNTGASSTTPNDFLAKGYDNITQGGIWFMWYNNNIYACIRNDDLYSTSEYYISSPFTADGNWHHLGFSINGGVWNLYIDKVLVGTKDMSAYNISFNRNTDARHIGGQIYSSYTQWYYPLNGKIDELIMENVGWAAQEEQAYFDATKTNYGL